MQVEDKHREAVEAAAFRRLVRYLREHTEVQNIDLMDLAGFCRNCLAKWYRAEAAERGLEMTYEQARESIYGMPYAEWKRRYQGAGRSKAGVGAEAVTKRTPS